MNTAIKPNVIIVTWHDTGRWFGCYGVEEVSTPNVDRLASEGMKFTNYYAVSTVCSPSRGCMLTGRYPHANGLMGLAHPVQDYTLNRGERHLSTVMKENGYNTLLFGFQHESPHHLIDEYLTFDETFLRDPIPPSNEVVECFSDYMKKRDKEAGPFYAQIGFFETHRHFCFGDVKPDTEKGIHIPDFLQDTPKAREEIALFQGSIKKADNSFGVLLETIKECGLEENTILVFAVDHGIHFPRAKATLYDPGLEIPLIIRWPNGKISGGKTCDTLLSNVDFFPTLLELLNIPVPENVQGYSFAKYFDNVKAETGREEIYAEFLNERRCIRTERFKLIHNFEPKEQYIELPVNMEKAKTYPIWPFAEKNWPYGELYDLEKDPDEFNNLYLDEEYREVRDELYSKLYKWMEETGDKLIKGPVPSPFYTRSLEKFMTNSK